MLNGTMKTYSLPSKRESGQVSKRERSHVEKSLEGFVRTCVQE